MLEGETKISKWAEEKYLNFEKFLGVSIERVKEKVIDLLSSIDQEASGDAGGKEIEMTEKDIIPIEEENGTRKIKLSISGRDTIKEEDFDEMNSDSLCKDYDLSSISGSDDEDDKESESILFENKKTLAADDIRNRIYLTENEVTEKLKYLIHEPRDNTRLRIVLLARGGHFAGCVFYGTKAVAHKTFHRYVIRAKAGKKQSSKDANGKMAHSAGASIRRHNELALKKEIQDLLTAWKPYFAVSSCIYIYAPSNNRQLLFDGDQPYFVCQLNVIRNIPLTVRRPTYKEARRIYGLLTQVSFEAEANQVQTAPSKSDRGTVVASALRGQSQSSLSAKISKEEQLKRAHDAEREKRAAAAERRLAAAAALKAQGSSSVSAQSGSATDTLCSCCNGSLAGKVPFHRYNYKYCSSACMHVHKEILEDD
ncbi:hypothetical protein K7X08_008012 [Anisodus acutangulus]|uniref:VLRF1 domain-containing protein n=1 Tax=Anisodus acutangulus TaxID=402998 RepID=A0A9Q1MQI3_9SOLA|nr:hypothetical protein K7X08_008012 [Anisodus acutangulus]